MRQVTMANAPVKPSEPVVVDDHVAAHGSRRILNRSIPSQEGKMTRWETVKLSTRH